MTGHPPAGLPAAEPALTFSWSEQRRGWLVVPAFLMLSLVAHGALFLLFQVVYPQRVTLPPPASQVALLTPSTPEHEALLRWIAAEDPALVAATAHATPEGLLDVPYRASFEAVRTPPRFAPPPAEVVHYPPAIDLTALIRSVSDAPPPSAPTAPTETTLAFSDSLAGRSPTAPARFPPVASAPLQPAHFLLGVSAAGEVSFAFLQKSSGDPAADAAASAQLARLSFTPAAEPIVWGFATIHWGDDAYMKTPSSR